MLFFHPLFFLSLPDFDSLFPSRPVSISFVLVELGSDSVANKYHFCIIFAYYINPKRTKDEKKNKNWCKADKKSLVFCFYSFSCTLIYNCVHDNVFTSDACVPKVMMDFREWRMRTKEIAHTQKWWSVENEKGEKERQNSGGNK